MITEFDIKILNFLQTLRTPFTDKVFSFITHLGDAGLIWIAIILIMFCFKKTRKCAFVAAISLIIGTLIGNVILKNLIERPRPFNVVDINLIISEPGGFSFPSGHTMSSFVCATAIFMFSKKWGVFALILASLIGFSRNYLFVHYPTDVIAGTLLGIGIGVSVYFVYKKYIEDKIKLGKIQI